jgi:hypothetical protein
VPERLAYPSSNLGYGSRRPESMPDIDLIVDAELVLLSKSGRSSVILLPRLAKLPYKLEPGLMEEVLPQLFSSLELLHCHAISGVPLLAEVSNSGYLGGGNGGGGPGSRTLGIDIGIADESDSYLDLKLPDLEGDLNRSEGLEPTYMAGKSSDERCAGV